MEYEMGEVFKQIRQAKKYTQNYVSDKEMSRSTYAKIESCDMQPTVGKFMHILEKLDISYSEFKYIQNGYRLNDKDKIIHDFFQISTNVESYNFSSLKNKCEQFLKNESDNIVQDILSVTRALIYIESENDYQKAYPFAKKVWDRLSKLDNWYTIELKLINNIFFFFPIDTGLSIVQRALKEIDKFSYISGNNGLKPAYLLNITLLLINNKHFNEALNYSEKSLQVCNAEKRYDLIAVAHARKGISLINMGRAEPGMESINRALQVCRILDQVQMEHAIRQEVNFKTDNRFHI
jgi:Rgg/GadR/MutR family transcriptional activator